MKIRIKDHSIRLRLTQKEVERFSETGLTLATTQFAVGVQFTYALQASLSTEEISATYERNRMTVHVPKAIADHWTGSQEVGFEAQMRNDTEEGLYLLVEKDFACLIDRAEEDESDNFPNPLAPIG